MKSILFLVLHRPDRSPGQRFRHEQYLDLLKDSGYKITYSFLLNETQDKIFYSHGYFFKKILIGFQCFIKRLKDILRASKYDYIFIYRDAFFFGSFIEYLLSKRNAKIIYDFDDAIWLIDKHIDNSFFKKLRTPNKVKRIITLADKVIVGNEYLAQYSLDFNKNTTIIPSTINTTYHHLIKKLTPQKKICIGWTGSFSTIIHFEHIIKVLKQTKEIYGDKIYFKLIGDATYQNDALEIKGIRWRKETEIIELSEIDIGIMPLPNNEWSKGKCGFKGLQYMALEIPTIMSSVGVNSEIISDGVNGFLAKNNAEWVDKLSLLIEDERLRNQLGKMGRKTVEERYSTEANKGKWLNIFKN